MKASKSSTTSGLSPLCSHFVIKKSSEWTFNELGSGIDERTGFHPEQPCYEGGAAAGVVRRHGAREWGELFEIRFGIRRSQFPFRFASMGFAHTQSQNSLAKKSANPCWGPKAASTVTAASQLSTPHEPKRQSLFPETMTLFCLFRSRHPAKNGQI